MHKYFLWTLIYAIIMKRYLFIAILCVAIFEAFGQSSMALARKSGTTTWLFVGIACYCVVAYGLYVAYKWKTVGIVNALWSSISILLMLVIGYFVFEERLKLYQWIGIVMIIIGICITQIGA